ncbi:prepilin-type N-terminal cleavage/methylation domain-containing protein [Hassallia byssoidea VB512170]|uniref:Prepilin-type N-terminal cleavage/methylation domain-containing protein n=1 Tax=Hassallia byssoidea VB512170 TaxID=1304833 RepID=A0A846H8K3_9CYAN|nr:type IV pilin-like G/H family protein [Hassalia byssoidea]NEU72930.1 prepilin-type N-terminal cleavage/methylation domain-containing protein [Hassalia byssoidea VB512170]
MLKPELQAKFLQHINRKKKDDEGFTLIELLVVVIIIGILAAIALPSLLGQVNKAKQSEAKNNIGAVNRAQQAFFLEYQGFASSLSSLQAGVKTQTDNFSYVVASAAASASSFVQVVAVAQKPALKSYYGATYTAVGDGNTSEALTLAVACESIVPTRTVASISTAAAATGCQTGFTSLAR